MIGDTWSDIVEQLAKVLQIKLAPDKNRACLLRFKNGVAIQMELDKRGENVLMVSDLGQVPQGRYRENLFREALKANGLPLPLHGIFAFGAKTESLLLYNSLSIEELTGQKLAEALTPFSQKAELWKNAITSGQVPSYMGTELSFGAAKAPGGLFGIAH